MKTVKTRPYSYIVTKTFPDGKQIESRNGGYKSLDSLRKYFGYDQKREKNGCFTISNIRVFNGNQLIFQKNSL